MHNGSLILPKSTNVVTLFIYHKAFTTMHRASEIKHTKFQMSDLVRVPATDIVARTILAQSEVWLLDPDIIEQDDDVVAMPKVLYDRASDVVKEARERGLDPTFVPPERLAGVRRSREESIQKDAAMVWRGRAHSVGSNPAAPVPPEIYEIIRQHYWK